MRVFRPPFVLTVLAILLAASSLTAQPRLGGQDATAEATAAVEPWSCPEGFAGQQLNVYNWAAYVAEDTIANFEAACDVTVVYDTYVSNEELLAKLSQGNPGYDVIVPSGYMIETMIEQELLEPLDYANIPNFANVSEGLKNGAYDPGNVYSVPYQWGTVGIAYDKTRVAEAPDSWDDMWTYEGPVAWLEDVRAMMGIALNNLGLDPNTDNPDEIAAARDYLLENGENVVAIVAADSKQLLESGTAHMVIDYPGNTFQLLAECECEDFAYVVPEEGTLLWTDNLAIPVDAPNKALAEVFIDYILDPQVGADISNYTFYGSPNQAAVDLALITPDLLTNPALYPDPEIVEQSFFIGAVPDAQQFYNDAWDEIRILLGQ